MLHSDYNSVFCGLFQGTENLATVQEQKIKASKNLMLILVTLLNKHSISWSDLDFLGVTQGPGPFTTLRVVMTTVNGLLFSKQIPLVGVDGLHAFLSEYALTPGVVVALLNAFNSDVYFGIKQSDGTITTGWEYNATFLQSLQTTYPSTPITFIGNGVAMHKELILNLFPHAVIPEPLPETVDLNTVAACALEQWKRGEAVQEPLLPLYLKTLEYKQST